MNVRVFLPPPLAFLGLVLLQFSVFSSRVSSGSIFFSDFFFFFELLIPISPSILVSFSDAGFLIFFFLISKIFSKAEIQ